MKSVKTISAIVCLSLLAAFVLAEQEFPDWDPNQDPGGWLEYSNETPMNYAITSGVTRTVQSGARYNHELSIGDMDKWLKQQGGEIASKPNYATTYELNQQAGALIEEPAPSTNPVVTRPSLGTNSFVYKMRAYSTIEQPIVRYDKFRAIDLGGSPSPPATNTVKDASGAWITVDVTTNPAPPAGGGGLGGG